MSKKHLNRLRYCITEGDSRGNEQALGTSSLAEILAENDASVAEEIRCHASEASFTIVGFTGIYYRFDPATEDGDAMRVDSGV